MARARNIKPGFFKNYDLADLGPMAQLLFSGLWCLADREGRLEDKPRLIKAELFPYYECDVNGELTKLERLNFLQRYVVNGLAVIEITNFKKHQTPHNTEKASTLPPPPIAAAGNVDASTVSVDNGGLTVDSPNCNDGNPPDSLIHRFTDSLIPDSLIQEKAKPQAAVPAAPKKSRKSALLPLPENFQISDAVRAWAIKNGYGDIERHFSSFIVKVRAKGYCYANWDSAFQNAIADDWAKLRAQQPRASPQAYESKRDKDRRETIEALTGRRQNEQRSENFIDIN